MEKVEYFNIFVAFIAMDVVQVKDIGSKSSVGGHLPSFCSHTCTKSYYHFCYLECYKFSCK